MQQQRLTFSPWLLGKRFRAERPERAVSHAAAGGRLGVWWTRGTTFACIGYVVFSQTLHAAPGWSRLGILFAVLLVAALAGGRVLRIWDFSSATWAWLAVPFLVYCLIRAVPESGRDWPTEELFPLACAFMGGIGVAVALRLGISFTAVAYAQVLSNACNISAGLLGFGAESIGGDPVRYAGVTGNANDFGLQLTLGSCLLWLMPKRAGWFPCVFSFFSVAYAVGTSGSRTALTVVPFFLLIVFVQLVALVKRNRVVFAVSLVTGTCVLVALAAPFVLDKAKDITAIDRALDHSDSSFEKRMGMIQRGLELWRQSPVFGNGLEGFERLSGFPGYYAHNNYAELLCNTGLLGTLLYYGLHLAAMLRGARLPVPARLCVWTTVLVLLVIDFGSVNYRSKQTIMILMVLLAITAVQHRAHSQPAASRARLNGGGFGVSIARAVPAAKRLFALSNTRTGRAAARRSRVLGLGTRNRGELE